MGRFVPMLTVRVGTETLEKGHPVHGSYKLDGIPLYALMGTELELVRLMDSVPELRVPGLELGETSA
ncbi:MAG: hypothetical protein JJ976_09670 [Rhodothermales bacterium]|nr:hypothetical protein [Rhodothermales bacterium]